MQQSFLASLIIFFSVIVSLFSNNALFAQTTTQNESSTNVAGDIYQFANQCYVIQLAENDSFLSFQNGSYVFSLDLTTASSFMLRPAALGVYLLFDQDKQFLIAENNQLARVPSLVSEMLLDMPEENYLLTPAEWEMHASPNTNNFQLKNSKQQAWLSKQGLSADKNLAAPLQFKVATNCANFPESETGARGAITKTQFEDGTLFGFIDAHEHIGANHGFGGKVFHGAGFHKLGIEHALADCEKHHGEQGSKDLMNIAYKGGSGNIKAGDLLGKLYDHLIQDKAEHKTDGYPTLTDWNVHKTATHQSLYYKWIERAYLGGMRMMVEYMESTEVVCKTYKSILPSESFAESCNEMVHVDHQLIKIKELQDYIDAQNGGPGKGWFRIVYSPEQAREVIKAGKLAVILGIEIENPFNCFIDEREGFEPCTNEQVREHLNAYYNKGVRALFPSHKFVNSFSSGDGDAGILEIGDYRNSGRWRDYIDCDDVPGDYLGSHHEGQELSLFKNLATVPGITTLNKLLSDGNDSATQALPIYPQAKAHCQRNGFTPLGLTLIDEMMSLGMIIDLGHTPKAALHDVMPVLVENNYPAVHTHGGDQNAINLLNGLSTRGLGDACRDEEGKSALVGTFNEIAKQAEPTTGLPRKGLSYDFNGFAGYNKPRFGDLAKCTSEQSDPLSYPFTAFGGDVVFEKLTTGNKTFDYNTEGLANIGLFPDLIEEAKRAGASEAELTLLFKTAEAYIRIWERAEQYKNNNSH